MRDLAVLLHETSSLMKRRFEHEARPCGLTLLQWRALRWLNDNGPVRQRALVEALEATPMTISDMAERMEKADLITRGTDPKDSRAKLLQITPTGLEKLEEMRLTANVVFEEITAGLSAEDMAAVHHGLSRIKENLGGN